MCPQGQYGPNCHLTCTCQNGGICDHVDGNCTCGLGWTGRSCEKGDFLLRWQHICTLQKGFVVSPHTHRQGQTVSELPLVRASGLFPKTVSSCVLLINFLISSSLFLLLSNFCVLLFTGMLGFVFVHEILRSLCLPPHWLCSSLSFDSGLELNFPCIDFPDVLIKFV